MAAREQRESERVEAPPTSALTCLKLGLRQRPIVNEGLLAAHESVGHAAASQMSCKRPGGAIPGPHRKEETFNAPHQQPLLAPRGSTSPVDKGEHAYLLRPAAERDAQRLHRDARRRHEFWSRGNAPARGENLSGGRFFRIQEQFRGRVFSPELARTHAAHRTRHEWPPPRARRRL